MFSPLYQWISVGTVSSTSVPLFSFPAFSVSLCLWATHSSIGLMGALAIKPPTQLWRWHLAHIRACVHKCARTQTQSGALWIGKRSDCEDGGKKDEKDWNNQIFTHSEGRSRTHWQTVAFHRLTRRQGRKIGESGRTEDERVHFVSWSETAENICGIFLWRVESMRRLQSLTVSSCSERARECENVTFQGGCASDTGEEWQQAVVEPLHYPQISTCRTGSTHLNQFNCWWWTTYISGF